MKSFKVFLLIAILIFSGIWVIEYLLISGFVTSLFETNQCCTIEHYYGLVTYDNSVIVVTMSERENILKRVQNDSNGTYKGGYFLKVYAQEHESGLYHVRGLVSVKNDPAFYYGTTKKENALITVAFMDAFDSYPDPMISESIESPVLK